MTINKTVIVVLLTIFWFNSYGTEYYKATTTLNVRNGAGTEYSILFSIKKGDSIKIVNQNNVKWFQIEYNGKRGYVSSKYLEYASTNNDEYSISDEQKEYEKKNMYMVVGIVAGVILLILFLSISSKKKKQPQTNIPSEVTTEQENRTKIVVTKSTKSVGLAIFLSIMFPYFGVLYSTISGFFWLLFSYLGMWGILFYWGFSTLNDGILYLGFFLSMVHWLISIIWSGIAASKYNKKLIL